MKNLEVVGGAGASKGAAVRRLSSAITLVLACWAFAGCASVRPAWPSIGRKDPRVNSFLGIGFGEEIADVRAKYPTGWEETSPYGAPAYRVKDLSAGPIHYENVVYEFAEGAGMQLVYAKFAPDSAHRLLHQLNSSLGRPATMRAGLGSDHERTQASWVLGEGEKVDYNGQLNLLVVLGPKGEPLNADIGLREHEEP